MSPSPADAYDSLAPTYDALLQEGQWMRARLWQRYGALFQPGQHLLELGCGTGLDTVFLARQGMRVTAVDISPGMLVQLQQKVNALSLAERITAGHLDLNSGADWPEGMFDGMVSAFAVLNTVANLAATAELAAARLRPGSSVIVHMLNAHSLGEWAALARRGQWQHLGQLRHQCGRVIRLADEAVHHHLYTAESAYAQFASWFNLERAYGLEILPGWLRRWERGVSGRRPFVHWGRFFVLEMRKRA